MKFEIGFEKFSQEAVFLENRTLGFIGNLHLQQGLGPDRFFFWIWLRKKTGSGSGLLQEVGSGQYQT